MAKTIYYYPVGIRIWHLFNMLLCLILIISGLSMQFSEPGRFLIPFKTAVIMHGICAILLIINYIFFLIANRVTGNRQHYRINEKNYTGLLLTQFNYYTRGIFKGEKVPFPVSNERKFNPLQQFTYIIIMYGLLPLIIITGLGLMFPGIVIPRIFGISGLFLTDLLHIIAGFVITLFIIVHIYFCTLGLKPISLFKSIITGWTEIH
jgi:thiosulfate reductase cytochrome b subunit